MRGRSEIVKDAFKELFPEKINNYTFKLKYLGNFKNYNANVHLVGNLIELRLSKEWQKISKEIQMGLIQELLVKLFRKRFNEKKEFNTISMDLYAGFIKNLHLAIPKDNIHPILEISFDRVNEKYFHNLLEKPNLVWKQMKDSTLGTYEYQTDIILMNDILKNSSPEMLDYVMYHEMLHKKMKFKHKNGRTFYHTYEFRKLEKQFEDYENVENKLKKLRRKKSFWW
ncbi:SprT-like domain-containing protein [Nanoarchaeota archaeon]